jgi:hypothetical protein
LDELQSTSDSSASQSSDSGTSYGAAEQNSRGWWIGCSVSVPIFSCLVNHADDVLLAQYRLAVVNYENGLDLVSRDVHNTADEFLAVQREREHYQAEVKRLMELIRWTKENLENTTQFTPDRVAAIRIQLVEAFRLWRQSLLRNRLAEIEVERAVGMPLDDALKSPDLKPNVSEKGNDQGKHEEEIYDRDKAVENCCRARIALMNLQQLLDEPVTNSADSVTNSPAAGAAK